MQDSVLGKGEYDNDIDKLVHVHVDGRDCKPLCAPSNECCVALGHLVDNYLYLTMLQGVQRKFV